MQSIKDIKAAILAEIEAEKKLQEPEMVDEPFVKADEAFRELAEFDVTKESIGTTVGAMRGFLHQLFEVLTKETLETLKKAEEENKETEKKKQEWEALPEFMRKDEEFVFLNPLQIMEKEFNRSFEKAEEEMTEKLTHFLDDRIHADRNSLVREKTKAKKQLYVAREMSEVFRRSYDQAARYRQEEDTRVLDEKWNNKFTTETTELKDKIEHLEFQRRLQAQTIKTRDQQLEESKEKIEEQKLALKDMKVKLDVAKKSSKGGRGGGGGHSMAHGYGAAGGAAHGAGASHSAPWNPNHTTTSSLSPHSSGHTTRVAEGKEGNNSSNNASPDGKGSGGNDESSAVQKNNPDAAKAGVEDAAKKSLPSSDAAMSGAPAKTAEAMTQTEADGDAKAASSSGEIKEADPVVVVVSQRLAEAKEMVATASADVDKEEQKQTGEAKGEAEPASLSPSTAAVEEKVDPVVESVINDPADSGDHTNASDAPVESLPPRDSPGAHSQLKKQTSSSSFLSTTSDQPSQDAKEMRIEIEEMRAEIKKLRAKLVEVVETSRSESPVPITSPLSAARKGGYYPRLGSSSESSGDSLGLDSPRVANSPLTKGYSDGVSPMQVTASGSAVIARPGREGGAGATAAENEDNASLRISQGSNGLPIGLGPGEGSLERASSAAQEGIGSVSVSQSGRGVILSSTRGGIEGEQGSLDLMSGYGLSQERSQVVLQVVDPALNLENKSVVSADGSRYSTNETLLADMRVGMAGDNILQSYGSSNDIGGDVERNMRTQLEGLQGELMTQMKKERELMEQLASRDLQVTSLGERMRESEKYKEEQEKLHSLQMLERGILLKELSQQVNDMRTQMRGMETSQKKTAKQHARELARVLSGGTPAASSSRPGTVERRTPVQVPMSSVNVEKGLGAEHEHKPIAAVTSGSTSVIVDPTKSTSRMLAASSSMPLLSDEYGNYATTGKDMRPNPGRLSPVYKLRGKSGEKTEFTMNDLDRDTRRVALDETANYMDPEKMDQLRSVRSQIVGMLSERYPPEKRKQQMLAVDKARERAQREREAHLEDKAVKKTIRL